MHCVCLLLSSLSLSVSYGSFFDSKHECACPYGCVYVSVYGYLDECLYVAFIRAYANTIESFAGSSVTF